MSVFEWFTIFLVCSVGAMIPGPSLIIILYIANSKNFISGVIASLGHGIGIFIYALVSIFSISFIIEIAPFTFQIIQFIGAIFLIYIGYKIIFIKSSDETKFDQKIITQSLLENFLLGLTTSLINPKVIIFFTSIFSQFLNDNYSLYTKVGMAFLAGIIDTTWYVLASYSVNLKSIKNFIKPNKKLIFFILGSILLIFSIYLIYRSMIYFLITN
jgi:threonine/homoserine/homoserine lactone efflux protein|tara:strand:- start:250 stop:891 length:642 start_codon:yes stop_codon:yes gene_type:complete